MKSEEKQKVENKEQKSELEEGRVQMGKEWVHFIKECDKRIQPMNLLLHRIFEWALCDYRLWKEYIPELDFNAVFTNLCDLVEKSLENGPFVKKSEDEYIS